jgi:hypothetical protein
MQHAMDGTSGRGQRIESQAAHTLASQAADMQSSLVSHANPGLHFAQVLPPQSSAVSSWFTTPS